jgi:hypothetical protein
MTTASPLWGTATTVTITLASLATSSDTTVGRQSNSLDLTSIDAIDLALHFKVTTGTSPTASKQIEIWAAASLDGSLFSGNASTADAGLTPIEKTTMRLLAIIPTSNTSDRVYRTVIPSLAAAFGGALPPHVAFWISHNTAVNLNATGGNHEIKYRALNFESA